MVRWCITVKPLHLPNPLFSEFREEGQNRKTKGSRNLEAQLLTIEDTPETYN